MVYAGRRCPQSTSCSPSCGALQPSRPAPEHEMPLQVLYEPCTALRRAPAPADGRVTVAVVGRFAGPNCWTTEQPFVPPCAEVTWIFVVATAVAIFVAYGERAACMRVAGGVPCTRAATLKVRAPSPLQALAQMTLPTRLAPASELAHSPVSCWAEAEAAAGSTWRRRRVQLPARLCSCMHACCAAGSVRQPAAQQAGCRCSSAAASFVAPSVRSAPGAGDCRAL